MLGTARRRCSLRLCQATPRWINQACASSARGLCGKPEEAKWFLENTDVPDDPRTVRFLQLAKEHGASEMRDCIDKQLAFSAVPTTMIGSGAMAALIGLNLGSVVHNGFVYVSGTGASNDTATGAVRTTSAFDETRGALDNISAVLEAAGSSAERIVVATMLLTDKQDYSECNRAYVRFFAELGLADRLPARSSALWAVPTTAKVAFSVVATVAPRTCTADSK